MSMNFVLYNPAGTFAAEVDANGVPVSLPSLAADAGYVRLCDKNGVAIEFGPEGRVDTAINTVLLSDPVDGAAVDIRKWVASNLTMTQTQAAGFITLNASAITTINTYSILTSVQNFDQQHENNVYWHCKLLTPNVPQANATMECGLGTVATTAAPTDGAFFRWTSAGDFRCVINNAGTEVQSAALTAPTINVVHHFEIKIEHGEAEFIIDGVSQATLTPGAATANTTNAARLPVFYRTYTGGTAPGTAPQLKIAAVDVWRTVVDLNYPFSLAMAAMGGGANQSPVTAFGQTANWANVTVTALATLSNTAASYTTLGGQFLATLPAGAAAAEYALFGYQVPVGWQLAIDAMWVSSSLPLIHTATATMVQWGIGINASAVSLATVDGAGTWAPRRIGLGSQTIIAAAAAGTAIANGDINRRFPTPLIVDSGRFFHTIMRVPNGAAGTASGFAGVVGVSGFFK